MIDEEFLDTVIGPAPEGWALGEVIIQIERPKRKRLQVEAWKRGPFAMHEREFADGRETVLTHAPTGLRIFSFPSVEQTIELADRIEPLTDWSAITKKMPLGSDLYPKVREIIDDINQR
ncbi:hypothetical protein [Bradyrhizobium sp. SZCCHNRI1073]|uniref:hypothetical protein n=1 Tax=Bradyrhizobium sp. SZCCHNRI1073 TaxID=3057280 RepID=UPI002916362A|nr:hypothetical protein [Bradyrhizobium sp. SZCCHNRI1073]